MASWIDFKRGGEPLGILKTSFHPILLAGQNRNAEVVTTLARMLQHRGFVVAKVEVDVFSRNRADTVLSVSPTYMPEQGMELAPAHGMW